MNDTQKPAQVPLSQLDVQALQLHFQSILDSSVTIIASGTESRMNPASIRPDSSVTSSPS